MKVPIGEQQTSTTGTQFWCCSHLRVVGDPWWFTGKEIEVSTPTVSQKDAMIALMQETERIGLNRRIIEHVCVKGERL